MTHTPGPWTFDPQDGPKGRCLMAQVYGPDGTAIADIAPTDPERFANANARFIALAPEVFDAAVDVVNLMDDTAKQDSGAYLAIKRLEAAIEKVSRIDE
jgi:hypothetical protein